MQFSPSPASHRSLPQKAPELRCADDIDGGREVSEGATAVAAAAETGKRKRERCVVWWWMGGVDYHGED